MKVSRIITILIGIFSMCWFSTHAVEPGKVQIGIDYHYAVGLGYFQPGYDVKNTGEYFGGGYTTVTGLYNINQKFSAGLGLGIGLYSCGEGTILKAPVFGTFRYRPFKKESLKNFYAVTDLGVGLGEVFWKVKPGFLWNIGIGWQKMFRKHFGLNFQITYNLHEFRGYRTKVYLNYDTEYGYYYDINRVPAGEWHHMLAFGVGLVF